MAEYERANITICENCKTLFRKHFDVFTVINLDTKGYISDNFRNQKINKVTCPHCDKIFTYELHFLAYSLKKGFAVLALPGCKEQTYVSGKKCLYDIFGQKMPLFRLVNYQCEVAEKVRIFESGLDDFKIEYLKHKFFDSKYFEDKTLNILLFKEKDGENLIFEYRDFLETLLETLTIPFEEYEKINVNYNTDSNSDDNIKWIKIDNKFFEETNYEKQS